MASSSSEANKASRVIGTPPKLSLLTSRPRKTSEMPTPPLQAAVSVPFLWEEAPGKPRPGHTESKPKPKSAKSLDLNLPPCRLVFSSPTTVLDGPYMGRVSSFTSSRSQPINTNYYFCNTTSSFRRTSTRLDDENDVALDASFQSSICTLGLDSHCHTTRVKIKRAKTCTTLRATFFSNISHKTSHFWVRTYIIYIHSTQFSISLQFTLFCLKYIVKGFN